MNLPRYVVRHGRGLHFRIIVPKPLRGLVGRSVIKHSLRTRDERVAQVWALVLAQRYSVAFQRLSRDTMAHDLDEILKSALGAFESGRTRDYTLTRSRNGTVTVATDGTAEDHKRAMEALAATQTMPAQAPVMPSIKDIEALAHTGLKRISLKKAIEEYKQRIKPDRERDGRSKVKTFNGPISKSLEEFEFWAGSSAYVYNLTRNDLSKFTTAMLSKGLAKSTVRDKLSYISGFFEFAQNSQYFANGDNPATKQVTVTSRDKRASAKRGWRRFTDEQLQAIFHRSNFKMLAGVDTRWISLLALYTGSRPNELAQIELVDCVRVGSLHCLQITDEGEDMSTKNDHTQRLIPLHPELIELGFLERVEALKLSGEKRLFPSTNPKALNGPAQAVGKKFSAYLKALKIEPRGQGIVGLRSFRPTVISVLAEANVHQGWRELYVGHDASDGTSTQNTDHAMRYTQAELTANIAKNCHPALSWSESGLIINSMIKPLLKN